MDLTAGPTEVGIFVRRNESAGDGLRVAIKDILDRAGEVTTGGSRSLATSAAATQSSDVVLLLEQAGCSIVGRANMHELAYGVTGINHWSGTPTNPRYHRLIPGGSSSGSAVAVAAGLVDFSIGSDTGGSIRIPAACCGIVGLKPTFGRVSRRGAVPANTSLDCIGPFARDVEMIEIAMSIIDPSWARYDDRPHGRIAFVGGQAEETIDKIVRASAVAHFECVDVQLPLFAEAVDAGINVIGRESWNAFGHLVATGLVGVDVGARLELAGKVSDEQLGIAEATRRAFTAEIDGLLSRFDAIALPTLPVLPPSLLDASDARAAIPITMNCRPFNLSGHPAISLPVGEFKGAPVALQLVGRKGEDEYLCALARQVTLFQ